MRYVSTRGGGEPLTFKQTILTGLARDGGLYLPATIPDVRDRLAGWRALRYQDLAFEIIRLFADDIPDDALRGIVASSYATFRHPDVTPVVKVGPVHLLELFHGPTLAFKDVALQFLGNLFEYVLGETGGEMNIVATSGDTGSAAIYGMRGRARIRIFVMHPHGRVSPVQERQMTTVLDDNVCNLAVEGTFDDCQNIVKDLFNDLPFRDACRLGAVNSINWARVLAQIVYYFYAAFRAGRTGAEQVRFSVPTGNFGDIFAGYMARCRVCPLTGWCWPPMKTISSLAISTPAFTARGRSPRRSVRRWISRLQVISSAIFMILPAKIRPGCRAGWRRSKRRAR